MAKWKSHQYYTVQLQDVLCSIIELTDDANITIGPHWYWGGQMDIAMKSGKLSGTIISVTEDVLPILYRTENGRLMAILPIQTVMEFQNETNIRWQDELSAQSLINKVVATYLAQ